VYRYIPENLLGMPSLSDPSDVGAVRKFALYRAACISSLRGLLRRHMQEG